MDKLLVISFSIIAHYFLLTFVHGDPITSCTQTPHPETCNHFFANNLLDQNNQHQSIQPFSLRDQSLLFAMNQATQTRNLISAMDFSSLHERAKLAWMDCLELYEESVDHLNRSITSKDPADSQTWLSAAITNHKTCEIGFEEFNLSYLYAKSFPDMLVSNFSKLLSNSLAINKASAYELYNAKQASVTGGGGGGGGGRRLLDFDGITFPSWVSRSNIRKLLQSTTPKADVVVAKDGSGNYKTISEAVAASVKMRSGTKRFVIYVKKGVYNENVEIKKSMKNIMLIGDGIDATVVTGNKNANDGSTTFRSATVGISGDGFIAKDMTFENTAGPEKHQAVALRSGSDFSVFYSCSFKGYQDTLYVYSQRQFYRNCDIYGTVDFIFGDAAAVLQNCNIYARKPMSGQKNTVTAQGRTDPNENTGIVVHNSRVTAASGFVPVSVKTYLGRPWQKYSRTVFLKCSLDGVIDPQGWLPWSGDFGLSTLYYGEYMNTGSGASTSARVKWGGYHVITSYGEAGKFTVGNFLTGNSWIPATGVPFESGL